ncbi:MAG: hypothetical protein H6Q72_2746 [Firmicutes bacterium]|nr:hypothetical protein [Bacillota bacterium]
MKALENLLKKKTFMMFGGVAVMAIGLSIAGCGSSQPQQTQPAGQQTQVAAPANTAQTPEKAYKDACQELELRGLNNTFTKYVNKQVKAKGPITEVQKLSDSKVRVKIQYSDTDPVWVTADKPMTFQPKVGKTMEFWGVLKGKGDKSKAIEVTAQYITII